MSDPTTGISLSLAQFAGARERAAAAHMVNGVTDYCFSLDKEIRRRMATVKIVETLGYALVHVALDLKKSLLQMGAVAVGPRQYPRVHQIAQDCAQRLGIGAPQIFIVHDPVPNAYTLAADQAGDMVVIHSSLAEATTDDELKFIVGHECGHIHNQHGVYNSVAVLLFNQVLAKLLAGIPGAGVLTAALGFGAQTLLSAWSRAAEITCDRAGLICVGDLAAGRHALAKLLSGGGGRLGGVNAEELARQLESVAKTPVRLLELFQTHPIIPKRLEALRLFSRSETLCSWRPEMGSGGAAVPASEIDRQCEELVRVLGAGYRGRA